MLLGFLGAGSSLRKLSDKTSEGLAVTDVVVVGVVVVVVVVVVVIVDVVGLVFVVVIVAVVVVVDDGRGGVCS